MTFNVRLSAAARKELMDAIQWYEEKSEGLGKRFYQAYRHAYQNMASYPDRYAEGEGNIRRIVIGDAFPYSLFYLYEHPNITVIAIFHNKRNPLEWCRRLH